MRILITGSGGFVGPHLERHLSNRGHTVRGFSTHHDQDVRDFEQVRHVVSHFQPDKIFHLAAVSWPGESLRNPRRVMDVNVGGAMNVLDAVRTTGSHARVLLAGTSEEYGYEDRRPDEILTEDSVCHPTTPYGVSKLAATTAGLSFARRYGLNVVATRAFNHTGWGRQAVNAESSFARRIVAVERGQARFVTHGDLSAVRNFTSVTDVIKAYEMVIDEDSGIYNVCSSITVPMQRIMDTLVGMAKAPIELKEDPDLVHRDAGTFPKPSSEKLWLATGWVPQTTLHSMLSDVLSYWRSR